MKIRPYINQKNKQNPIVLSVEAPQKSSIYPVKFIQILGSFVFAIKRMIKLKSPNIMRILL